jgi:molecular chaperone DnaK (HSP70)
MMNKLGIDLGTSQSAGCYPSGKDDQKREKFTEVENELVRSGTVTRATNEKFHPSYVQYDKKGNAIVAGMRAKMLANGFPKSTVYDSKRIIGRRFDDPEIQDFIRILKDRGHYEVCDDGGHAKACIGSEKIAPEQAGAEIIIEILKDAFQQEPGLRIQEMIISVPAYFTNTQKRKTKEAAMLAIGKLRETEYGGRVGIDISGKSPEDITSIKLIPEPSAAFITYMAKGGYQEVRTDKYVMVFDFGAGTLDITIGTARVNKDPITKNVSYTLDIKMTHGNTMLGGRDMDQKLIEYIVDELKKMGVPVDNKLMWDVREKAERSKVLLSTATDTIITFVDQGKNVPLTRAKLEELIKPILEQCRTEIRKALEKAGVNKGDITNVVMVGGPTYMPSVRSLVESEVGLKIKQLDDWDPMLCVAEGAARSGSAIINEVIPFDYYIAVEMFEGANVATCIAAVGEPANVDKHFELKIPLYYSNDINDVKMNIVEAVEDNGNGLIYNRLQDIELPVGAVSKSVTEVKDYRPNYRHKDMVSGMSPVQHFNYGKLIVECKINSDGLIIQPTFMNPGTGNKITYPNLPPWNMGSIEVMDEGTFNKTFEKYAKAIIDSWEQKRSDIVDKLALENHVSRSEALKNIRWIPTSKPSDIIGTEKNLMTDSARKKQESMSGNK